MGFEQIKANFDKVKANIVFDTSFDPYSEQQAEIIRGIEFIIK